MSSPRPADVIYDVATHLAAALERIPATAATDEVLAAMPPQVLADTLLPVLGALVASAREPGEALEEAANSWAAEVADTAGEDSFESVLWRATLLDVAAGPPDRDARAMLTDLLGGPAQLGLATVLLAGELAASVGVHTGADPVDVFFAAGQRALAGPLAA